MPERDERPRRRLDEVFGDVLPAVTRDELVEGERDAAEDDELLVNRPPHHDRE